MKMMRGFFFLVVLLAGFWVYQLIYIGSQHRQTINVDIPKNSSAQSISHILHAHQVVSYPKLFYIYLRLTGNAKHLKPGEYDFNQFESFNTIRQALLKGSVKLYRVVIPEGFSVYDIADLLAANKIARRDTFLAAAFDPNLCKRFGIPGQSFEGFLFPNTYMFEKSTPVNVLLKTMHEEFKRNLNVADQIKAKRLGLSLLEWITLASIIEKESSNVPEQPIISSVFHNRLRLGMRLQTDPTVIYGIENFDGNLTRKHLRSKTPYNTYVNYGLPPGPIANPGSTAIKAAVNPAQTDYLYFVAMGSQNKHYFSKSYKEHLHAVRFYQLKKGSPPPAQN